MSFLRLLLVMGAVGVIGSASTVAVPPDAPDGHPMATGDDCSRVTASIVRITGHDSHAMPQRKINDDDLEVCRTSDSRLTCCTRLTERRLHQAAMDDMRDIIATTSRHLKDLLTKNSEIYRNEFLQLLVISKNATKSLLSRTYQIPPAEFDAEVDDLFQNLCDFMERETDDIGESITAFFDSLFSSVFIFTINDSDGSLVPPDQRSCFKRARKDLSPSPFSEMIHQLTHSLNRSIGVARSLLDAFDLAIEVINTTDHLDFEHECSRGLTRLLYCSYCDGHTDIRPCQGFCMDMVHGCLTQVAELNLHWNLFVDAVERLALSMRGMFDLQGVLADFHSRVSNSILHAMETVQKYHVQLVSRCGSVVRFPARDASNATWRSSDLARGLPGQSTRRSSDVARDPGGQSTRVPEVWLRHKIEMFVKNLADSRGFYHKLPDTLCSSEKLSAGNYDICWNGTSLNMYTKTVPVQDFSQHATGSPVVPGSKQSVLFLLSEKLDNMTKLLYGRIVPKISLMQSDERSREPEEESGLGSFGSGDGKIGYPGTDSEEESGSSSATDEDIEEEIISPRLEPSIPDGKDRSKGVGGGKEATVYITNTDFVFSEKSTRKSQPPFWTKSPSDGTITRIYAGTGSTSRFSHYGCLVVTASVLILLRALW